MRRHLEPPCWFRRVGQQTVSVVTALTGIMISLPFCIGEIAAQDSPQRAEVPSGTQDKKFWSFRPLLRPELPQIQDSSVSGIDAFVLSRLEKMGLTFSAEADRRTLCRRLHLDLIGLPPSPDELRTFLNDSSPRAVELLVERLLACPQYGERWGRQWLDVVGYADSNGYHRNDSPRPLAYRYRDYVIQSLNEDKPYDQFWREQLAGDELAEQSPSEQLSAEQMQRLVATHYL